MIENRPAFRLFCHAALAAGVAAVCLPLWIAFVGSTRPASDMLSGVLPLTPGGNAAQNYAAAVGEGVSNASTPPVGVMLWNSAVMAVGVAVGKIVISMLSAFAIVFFRFPLRRLCFWLIFLTLMLPVEVRIVPTFQVVADLGLLNTHAGLIIPLIASATATFLFRQFFLTVPDELAEAARVDGASPMRFFRDILLPLSRVNIAAIFVVMFVYGWNQYLWPLLVTTEESKYTVVMGIQRMVTASEEEPLWNLVMAATVMALAPPVLVIVAMRRLFVRGLIEGEK